MLVWMRSADGSSGTELDASGTTSPDRIMMTCKRIVLLALLSLWCGCSPARIEHYKVGRATSIGGEEVELLVLRNDRDGVEASIAPAKGGELSGLRVRFQDQWIETLYLGRDYSPREGWTGKAPLLWPATGRNFPPDLVARRQAGEVFHDGAYEWSGKRYPMAIHGFARDFAWTLEESGADESGAQAKVSFSDNPETSKMYPFGFRVTADYVLSGRQLELKYTIAADRANTEPMPFSVGNHITFNTPLVEGSDPARMVLVTPSTQELLKTSYNTPSGETRPRSHAEGIELGDFERRIAVSLTGYEGNPFIVLRDPQGLAIRMSHRATSIPQQPVVLYNLWGDALEGFFSPEPWVGLQNSLVMRKGLVYVDPGEQFDWTILIEISTQAGHG